MLYLTNLVATLQINIIHVLQVEVLWSTGVRKLPPLSPLLVKGRNLYKQKTYRQVSVGARLLSMFSLSSHSLLLTSCSMIQRWKNEADRVEVLHEKHRRGAAARSKRALKNKKRSCFSNESRGNFGFQQTGLLQYLILFTVLVVTCHSTLAIIRFQTAA